MLYPPKLDGLLTACIYVNSIAGDLDDLVEWGQKSSMSFNASKCNIMRFSQKKTNLE